MQLLRDNQETLLTILEVLLCDPLYSWSVKTAQQNAPATTMNKKDLCKSSDSNYVLNLTFFYNIHTKASSSELSKLYTRRSIYVQFGTR